MIARTLFWRMQGQSIILISASQDETWIRSIYFARESNFFRMSDGRDLMLCLKIDDCMFIDIDIFCSGFRRKSELFYLQASMILGRGKVQVSRQPFFGRSTGQESGQNGSCSTQQRTYRPSNNGKIESEIWAKNAHQARLVSCSAASTVDREVIIFSCEVEI